MSEQASSKPLLRQAEQICAGSILIGSLATIAVVSAIQWRQAGGRINLDESRPNLPAEFQLDVNRAGAAELRLLPGVGDTLAHRIIDSRRAEGAFRSSADLLRVRGIGPRTLERIKPYLSPLPGDE